MHARSMLLPALAGLMSAAVAEDRSFPETPAAIFARQNNVNSTCEVFGIDFQDGGSYFINTNSNQSFTAVSKFGWCNNDTASILLVNESTEDEYECTSVATVPSEEPMLSTCPILKNQITSGKYLILALGNNAGGNPFAYQREFSINAGPQQTKTVTPTATYRVTVTPTVNVRSTSIITKTSHVSNNMTFTEHAATRVSTTTPAEITVTSTSMNTRTFWRWTSTQSVDTVSVTPACTVPIKPRFPDPPCTIIPKDFALPSGLHISPGGGKPMDVEYVRKRFENHRAAKARSAAGEPERQMEKRGADAPTTTVTASTAVITTTTITTWPTTSTDIDIVSQTVYTTDPPKTIQYGTAVETITAPAPTDVIQTVAVTRTYVTKTWGVTWTRTVTVTPTASASACQKEGGHFGPVWGGDSNNGDSNNGDSNNDGGNGDGRNNERPDHGW